VKDNDPTKPVCQTWFEFVDSFRVGDFGQASVETQLSWYVFCDRILPTVARKKWKSSLIRANALLSDVVTISDETYAILVSKQNMAKWILKLGSTDPKQTTKRRRNDESDSFPRTVTNYDVGQEGAVELDDSNDYKDTKEYYDLFEIIKQRREDESGKSWDDAFRENVSIAMHENLQDDIYTARQQQNNEGNESLPNQRKLVVEEWVEL
jgi:hypothetical protein